MVAPGTVHQKQLAEETELCYRHICAPRRLETFQTTDTHANVRCLDHRNIVGTVANSECDGLLLILLDHLHDEGFLQRRDTTADDGFAHNSQVKEQLLHVLLESIGERLSVDDEGQRLGLDRSVALCPDGFDLLLKIVPGRGSRLLIDNE